MTARKGYTLIEILIVIALFSILLSLALPNLNFYLNFMERQEMEEFRNDLLYARNMAILENRYYIVYFFQDLNAYMIKTGEHSPAIKNKTFNNGLRLSKNSTTTNFTFTSTGAPANSGTVYIVNRKGRRYRVTLSPATGRIEVKLE